MNYISIFFVVIGLVILKLYLSPMVHFLFNKDISFTYDEKSKETQKTTSIAFKIFTITIFISLIIMLLRIYKVVSVEILPETITALALFFYVSLGSFGGLIILSFREKEYVKLDNIKRLAGILMALFIPISIVGYQIMYYVFSKNISCNSGAAFSMCGLDYLFNAAVPAVFVLIGVFYFMCVMIPEIKYQQNLRNQNK